MKTLLHTEFAALLGHADVRQASFARLTGVTPRQVNNWCRGRAGVPQWAAALAVVLAEFTPEALAIMLEEAAFSWYETLGVSPRTDASTARKAMTKLALIYHPDTGGSPAQMIRVNAAYEAARASLDDS
jgi:DNA-binding transcriptional regulator YdaS (Cro superfamily)